MKRLTKKVGENYCSNGNGDFYGLYNKLGQLEDEEELLDIDLLTFLKGEDHDTCFMRITKDGKFDFCGDAYYGEMTKEQLLNFIQELIYMYRKLVKEELK